MYVSGEWLGAAALMVDVQRQSSLLCACSSEMTVVRNQERTSLLQATSFPSFVVVVLVTQRAASRKWLRLPVRSAAWSQMRRWLIRVRMCADQSCFTIINAPTESEQPNEQSLRKDLGESRGG
jgi:hypothetical protein